MFYIAKWRLSTDITSTQCEISQLDYSHVTSTIRGPILVSIRGIQSSTHIGYQLSSIALVNQVLLNIRTHLVTILLLSALDGITKNNGQKTE